MPTMPTEACRTEAIDATLKEYVNAAARDIQNILGTGLDVKGSGIYGILEWLSVNSASCAKASAFHSFEGIARERSGKR